MLKKTFVGLCCLFIFYTVGSASQAADTLEMVKSRGELRCGVHPNLTGFSTVSPNGNRVGFDVDFCRAVAAAILGNARSVEYVEVDTTTRLERLAAGDYEILSRTTTWTTSREYEYNLLFVGVMFYDGQGFMARRNADIYELDDFSGKSICVQRATTTLSNILTLLPEEKYNYRIIEFDTAEDVINAYDDGDCEVVSNDVTALYADLISLSSIRDHIILPELISKEPLGPAVRDEDVNWFKLVRWIYYSLIEAEELGISKKNVESLMQNSQDPRVQSLLGITGDFGAEMGLSKQWLFNVVSQVGNYGDIFEANLGSSSKLGTARGINSLWSQRGLLYSPPIK